MKTLDTSTHLAPNDAPIDAAALATLDGRSKLLARMMRTGVRAGASATAAAGAPALRFAVVGVEAPALRFA